MALKMRVISQQPPGGRCTLYADYADVLARRFGMHTEVTFSETRDAHGKGFPSLWLNDVVLQPMDGVILMPADITTALAVHGLSAEAITGLAEILEAPLERLMKDA